MRTCSKTVHSTHHEGLYFYFFFSVFLPNTTEVQGEGAQDPSGGGSQGQGRCDGGGGKGRIFEAIEEGVEWCGPRSIWEEEVLGEVSVWV